MASRTRVAGTSAAWALGAATLTLVLGLLLDATSGPTSEGALGYLFTVLGVFAAPYVFAVVFIVVLVIRWARAFPLAPAAPLTLAAPPTPPRPPAAGVVGAGGVILGLLGGYLTIFALAGWRDGGQGPGPSLLVISLTVGTVVAASALAARLARRTLGELLVYVGGTTALLLFLWLITHT